MVNQTVLLYLREYKDAYPLESLRREILAKGYSETDITQALALLHAQKFKPGDVNRLPVTDVVAEHAHSRVFVFLMVFLIICSLGIAVAAFLYIFDILTLDWLF